MIMSTIEKQYLSLPTFKAINRPHKGPSLCCPGRKIYLEQLKRVFTMLIMSKTYK